MQKKHDSFTKESCFFYALIYTDFNIRTAMSSVADLCVIPMQDILNLGEEARMNFPGTMTSNNWTWRAQKGFITEELTKRIYETTQRYGRL